MAKDPICSIEGCDKPSKKRGLCFTHHDRLRFHGVLGGTIQTKAPDGAPAKFLAKAIAYEGDDCLLWPYHKIGQGYGAIWDKEANRSVRVTQLVCKARYGPAPKGKTMAAHSCRGAYVGCCNPKHLRWASPQENRLDCVVQGTHNGGERHAKAVLTVAKVRAIRALVEAGETQRSVADTFSIGTSQVNRIVKRQSWREI